MAAVVVELIGEQRTTVSTALSKGFADYGALAEFTETRLGLRLNSITHAGNGLDGAAREIVKRAQADGALAQLVGMLAQQFPDFAPLQALVVALSLDLADFAPVAAPQLDGLSDAARDPETRKAFAPYRLDLANLSDLAVEIRDWKFLHDQVDAIRNVVFMPLQSIRAILMAAGPIVKALQSNLETGATSIAAKADAMELSEDDRGWIDMRLAPARATLAEAVTKWPAEPEYDYVMEMLSIVTSSDLTSLNVAIKSKAENITALRIGEKLALLRTAVTTNANSAQTAQVDKDIQAVESGVAELLACNIVHNRWQRIKDELAPLVKAPDRTAIRAQMAWKVVDPMLARCDDRPTGLDELRATINSAFADPAATGLADALGKLDGMVAQQFFATDKNLLVAAEALGGIGAALKQVLELLDA